MIENRLTRVCDQLWTEARPARDKTIASAEWGVRVGQWAFPVRSFQILVYLKIFIIKCWRGAEFEQWSFKNVFHEMTHSTHSAHRGGR